LNLKLTKMRVVVLGAGISGHTAAAFLKKKLGKNMMWLWFRPASITSGFRRTFGLALAG
jgi:protoporphyrinogen oxidase